MTWRGALVDRTLPGTAAVASGSKRCTPYHRPRVRYQARSSTWYRPPPVHSPQATFRYSNHQASITSINGTKYYCTVFVQCREKGPLFIYKVGGPGNYRRPWLFVTLKLGQFAWRTRGGFVRERRGNKRNFNNGLGWIKMGRFLFSFSSFSLPRSQQGPDS